MSVSRPAADVDSCGANFQHAGPRTLAKDTERAPSQRDQHGVGGDGGVSDERRFLARIEEAQPHIVVRARRGEDEGDFGMGELARDGHHCGIALTVRVQDHGRGIAGEASASECVNLKNSQASPPPAHQRSFARIGAAGYTSCKPWGGP